MTKIHYAIALAAGVSFWAGHSCADITPPTSNPAPPVAKLLADTTGASGVFVADDGGGVRHLQSGMVCPEAIGFDNLWTLAVFDPQGGDVGCDYGRVGKDNIIDAKLSIYATRAGPGNTVDVAFARYETEVTGVSPGAKVVGPVFGDLSPEIAKISRSERFNLSYEGHPFISDLVVALKGGWVIEVRNSVGAEPSDSGTEAAEVERVTRAAFDQALATVSNAGGGQ